MTLKIFQEQKVSEIYYNIPYSSKILWHNIFVNFVIDIQSPKFTSKILIYCGHGCILCMHIAIARSTIYMCTYEGCPDAFMDVKASDARLELEMCHLV